MILLITAIILGVLNIILQTRKEQKVCWSLIVILELIVLIMEYFPT